jgi:phthalate 4,5-dioxygenase oxygenase subunit
MMSPQDNELLTRVGPGTAMGSLMRQYWLPACKSQELEAGGPPMRLLLLGEKLIAFRDSSGRVGIMDHRCPHRCASLFFGRNEPGGVRCVYHGWKFDVEGNCLEMPNVPPHQEFSQKVKAKAYKATERNGLVWAYMGPRAEAPPLPQIEATLLAEEEATIRCTQRESNWLQNLEGDIDTSHFGFLHLGMADLQEIDPANMHRFALINKAPEYYVAETEWGTMYGAYRNADRGEIYYRFAHFVFPFWTLYPDGSFEDHIVAQAWVPMDDTHTMNFNFTYKRSTLPLRTDKRGKTLPGLEPEFEYLPNSSDWHGRWRRKAGKANDFGIDRKLQATASFTGIKSVPLQDQAIIESMGDIVDRGFEHLAPSDKMVSRTRRRLMTAARALATEQIAPPAIDNPEICRTVRSGSFLAPAGLGWMEAYRSALKGAKSPTGTLRVVHTDAAE